MRKILKYHYTIEIEFLLWRTVYMLIIFGENSLSSLTLIQKVDLTISHNLLNKKNNH